MSLFPAAVIDLIAKSAYWADRSIRSELVAGLIAGENDYTSNFTAEFRRQINAKAYPGLTATSFVLPATYERKVGADACIVLSNNSEAKICLFEGKWPRLSTHSNAWDNRQKSTGGSHFTNQIDRQSGFQSRFIIWEMFYCEYPYGAQPAPFRKYVSTCILHDDARQFLKSRTSRSALWTDSELISMLGGLTGKPPRVDQLITGVCECTIGSPIDARNIIGILREIPTPMQILSIVLGDRQYGYA